MRQSKGPVWLGILLIALGLVWLMNNLGITQVDIGDLLSTYWPLLLVIWGLEILLKGLGRLNGLVLIVIGALILGRNLDLYALNLSIFWKLLWPTILVLIGWNILRGTSGSGGTHWAVMSGIELKNKGWKLESGNFIAIMGGAELDLTVASIPDKETVLNLTSIMGGIDIKVPEGLNVECEGTAILGGVQFFDEEAGGIIATRRVERKGTEGSNKKVRIHCRTLMGGIEIKRG